ncbi:uncharacterized protein PAC_10512 [Phialocephala subalpina]|uniref:C2H2-type domain-containing protein n=1 Tax=Phialocephala subalpina TaxID=576137 RepID=A0A1L7X6G2_9HELO|nr:uncharacterized protein PAC_10512 [Phialocephala subalpina]
MANQSNYYRSGPRTYMPSLSSINSTDSGHFHGHTREMRPPVPPPVEVADLSISRTLPSPTATASSNLDLLPPPGPYGDMSYGNPNNGRIYQFPTDNQIMRPSQDPIQSWYSTQDGPWTHVSKVNPVSQDIISDERFQSKQTGSRNHNSSRGQYKQHQHNPSEAGSSFHFGVPGVPHSDSGYGTRRSVANTSVFSGDAPERDQDCQSLAGHVENYQPFGYIEDMAQRDARSSEPWNASVSSLSESRGLVCPDCHKAVKTQSEMKKHELRHTRPFECNVQGCNRIEGFSTPNDLDRHMKSKHSELLTSSTGIKKFRCVVPGCKSKDKAWPRLDNFKSHLKRVHQLRTDEAMDTMVKSGEFWEQPGLHVVDELSVEQHTLPDLAQPPAGFAPRENFTRPQVGSSWTPYPQAIEPAHDLIAPKGPQAGLYDSRSSTSDERSPHPEAPQQTIVKPGDVLRNYVPENISLDRMSLVPAGHDDSAVSKPDQAKSHAGLKVSPQGKAPRQNNSVSAATATLQAIKTVLAELDLPEISNEITSSGDLERSSLPNATSSPRETWNNSPNPAMRAQDKDTADAVPALKGAKDSQIEKKAAEVLKIFTNLGFTLSKDPTHSPKQHNIGSAASHRSENQVTCQTCKKFTGRPCELKKHMKRHERPYGCTFLTCNKVFGSKNDWKRHENSQHFHLEIWRCSDPKPDESPCTKVCYRRLTFQEHLKKDHHIEDEAIIKTKTDNCRLGRNCQARFWCGFCGKSVDLKKKGLEAWTERFDHIDDHFMGRGMPKQSIREWIPVDSDKPKGDVASPPIFGESSDKESPNGSEHSDGSPTGSSSDPGPSSNPGESSATAIDLETQNPVGSKRRAEEAENSRPPKRSKTATAFEKVVYCCECGSPHNPRLHFSCSTCDESHRWCSSCQGGLERVERDLSPEPSPAS